jgi:peptide deformylase
LPVREVVRLPARVLKEIAVSAGIAPDPELAADLLDTMRASPACVGLAAPQIGVSVRAFALDVSAHPKAKVNHGTIVMFDPVVVAASGREIGREGCMSVPDWTANVGRATEIVVQGVAPDGSELVIATEGFEARAFQHEIDHLDGLLILDRVSSLETDVFRRRVYK